MPSTNRLAHESSPYLRQHAHNPVDWFSWGEEAIARARQLDRPIFLSIGYSACHWCHVMEHESFENDEIARILNDNFVSIKVDREERPDLDQIYMHAVQMISGQGGWPMTVFLTPDLKPFAGGTYFPPEDRYGRPGFKRILLMLAQAWKEKRGDIDQAAADVTNHLQGMGALPGSAGPLNADLLRGARDALARAYEPRHGGFGQAPKFLHSMDLRLLLRLAKRFDDEEASHMARNTLDRMAMGGIYDHLGGGFARYSTDDRWLVPHFEKMLYDNALLVVAYLEGYQAMGEPMYARVVEETLGWVSREMTSPDGPFFSTLDADSEGVEGKFYVWTQEEIEATLGDDAPLFMACYDVRPNGNWTDPHDPKTPKNILHLEHSLADFAMRIREDEAALRTTLDACREKLRLAREKRVRPGLDDKTLTAWNGLMITAFATAAAVLDRPDYAETASRAADFILAKMRTPDGRLLRTCSPNSPAKLNGYLEDYAYLLEGLVSLYEATFDPRRLDEARDIARVMLGQFWDDKEGGFFYTGNDHEALIARGKDPHDNATPSGNSVAVTALLRLVKLTGDADLLARAETTLGLYAELMQSRPFATAQMLIALDYYLGPVQEFAVVGDLGAEGMRRVLRAIRKSFRPHKAVAAGTGDRVPLLAGKAAKGGEVTTYLCEDFACQEPLVGPEAVESALGS